LEGYIFVPFVDEKWTKSKAEIKRQMKRLKYLVYPVDPVKIIR
jgi:hypothetical protein